MGPSKELDGDTLRANVAAFAALGAPVAAVVKRDGYGWGARRLAREIDPLVDSYVVADADELAALRPATAKPVRLLADAPPGLLGRVIDLGGIANVSTAESVAEAAAEAARRGGLTVRVGVVDAGLWAAVPPAEIAAFAALFAGSPLSVELWTHVSAPSRQATAMEALAAARRAFAGVGVRVASVDADATGSVRRGSPFDRVRVGAGLFGARLGAEAEPRCAIRVTAPVVRRLAPGAVAWAGYGETPIPENRTAVVLRCGYGDGLPRRLAGTADILSVGMQYTVRLTDDKRDARVLIGAEDDLDALAARVGTGPHELVVGLAWR